MTFDRSHHDELAALVEAYGEDLPLDRALLLIAKEEHPELEPSRYLAFLEMLGERVLNRTADGGDLTRELSHAIFFEAGFRGNRESYYDPRNSLLNVVIDRRLGIPITLAVIFIEVARRAGTHAVGVGFPGHFLVRHESNGRPVLLDPFNKGSVLRRADCERLLRGMAGPQAELESWMLEPASPRAIVVRVLTNLKNAYVLQKDLVGAVKTLDRLLIVDPSRLRDRRDRGMLFKELNCPSAALADLEAYLEHATDERELDQIRRLMPELVKQRRLAN